MERAASLLGDFEGRQDHGVLAKERFSVVHISWLHIRLKADENSKDKYSLLHYTTSLEIDDWRQYVMNLNGI
ncbi:hypothetical protein NQZ68_019298 [Dissostichus eleginoides]|nr:hypothetical protein NQZ68_019298 [Dissostichus eleginoides]